MRRVWVSRLGRVALMASLIGLISLPVLGASGSGTAPASLKQLSQAVAARYYLAHPDQAPQGLRAQLAGAQALGASARGVARSPKAPPFGDRFNNDVFGLPQNEESVSYCTTEGSRVVLEGTNDYRGLLNNQGNFTGWHLSLDGGETLQNEGLLPQAGGDGLTLPSGGDPVNVVVPTPGGECVLYAASLNYDFSTFPAVPSGVGVYKTDLATASSCDTSTEPFVSNPDCWPTRKLVATNASEPDHFLDKEWMDVGETGDGVHVWVVYSDFEDAFGPVCCRAQIKAVRCDMDLSNCTAPILISGTDDDIQFGDVTVGPDGRTYVSWVRVFGELQSLPQRFTLKMRVAEAGSTVFGPTHTVARITKPLPFGGFLHANDFRIASVPKNAVKFVSGHPRVFITYDECKNRPLGTICEEPLIRLAWSDDFGASWTNQVISAGGDNYFPTIDNDTSNGMIVVAHFTNRYDGQFHNRQDVDLITLNAATGNVVNRQRVTSDQSNETEADPLLGGFFIGDYIEVTASGGVTWIGYNANIRNVELVGSGVPVPQQDNFLTRTPE
jgi:hypothetical protein